MSGSNDGSELIRCGEEAAAHFAFAKGYKNLNHGSYGTYPLAVRSVLRDYQERIEARPDAFVRLEYRDHLLDESRRAIARYLDVPEDTCVFTPNATTGVDTVLRNLTCSPGDAVICFATVYDSFESTLAYLSETTPLSFHKIPYTLPVSDASICAAFESAIRTLRSRSRNPVLALFDTVSSVPGARMPFERLVALCREHAVLSCLDAAHGVGQIPLRLRELDPDFFVSNCHKWLYVPRGCAVLHVPRRNQHLLRVTLPTGVGFVPSSSSPPPKEGDGGRGVDFVANFSDTGTMDDTPILCVPAAIAWRRRLVWGEQRGEEAIMGYIWELARAGGRVVAGILGTEVLENEEGTLGECAMSNVRLPLAIGRLTGGDEKLFGRLKGWVTGDMVGRNETAVYVIGYDGNLWVRLSAQVYLTLSDFEYAGRKLKETCDRVEAGEWL